ncbi:hypothetical protein MTO96_039143 [Rhipicephalus appendiculatus]
MNHRFVERCNREASQFNNLLLRHCRKTSGLFFIDNGLEWLPPSRVLAADGLHRSFEGVALMASYLHQTLRRSYARTETTLQDHFSAPTSHTAARQSPPPTSATSTRPNVPTTAPSMPREHLNSTFAVVVQTTPGTD